MNRFGKFAQMNDPKNPDLWSYRTVKLVSYFMTGVLVLGALLDSIGNAIQVINPTLTYIFTIPLLVLLIFQDNLLETYPINWRTSDRSPIKIRRLGIQLKLILFGMLILLWIPRAIEFSSQSTNGRKSNQIPEIILMVSNSTEELIYISPRNDFSLLLPGSGWNRYIGKYKITLADRQEVKDLEYLEVQPKSKSFFSVDILNDEVFQELLQQEECDLSLWVGPRSSNRKLTDPLPFTRDTIEKYYAQLNFEAD